MCLIRGRQKEEEIGQPCTRGETEDLLKRQSVGQSEATKFTFSPFQVHLVYVEKHFYCHNKTISRMGMTISSLQISLSKARLKLNEANT